MVLITPVCLPRVSWGKSDVDAQSGNTPVSMCEGNFLIVIRWAGDDGRLVDSRPASGDTCAPPKRILSRR